MLPIWLPDGRLAWRTPDRRNYKIRDLQTGREEWLLKDSSVAWVISPRFAPSGDALALSDGETGLFLLTWPGRQERKLREGAFEVMGWSADSEWVYAHQRFGRNVIRVSRRTGTAEIVGSFPVGNLPQASCSLMPDDSAVICGVRESEAEAWIMEHFDPNIR